MRTPARVACQETCIIAYSDKFGSLGGGLSHVEPPFVLEPPIKGKSVLFICSLKPSIGHVSTVNVYKDCPTVFIFHREWFETSFWWYSIMAI